MKLYVWQPLKHGKNSIFIMSESKENAINKIKNSNICNLDIMSIEEYLKAFYSYQEVDKDVIVWNEND